MAQAKHKAREVKKKTIFDRLKGSALFVLFMIILLIIDIVAFIGWLSRLLSGSIQGMNIVTDATFTVFAGLGAALFVFFAVAWFVQRKAHGPPSA